jgi:hypothetical protein
MVAAADRRRVLVPEGLRLMATLALAAAGAAVGGALLPPGISVLGATITGAAIGSQVGALAGSFVDQALFGPSGQSRTFQGPRLSDLQVTASTEGAPIPRLYGRARLGGQVIWATDVEEEIVSTTDGGGSGKGRTSSSSGSSSVTRIEYRYYGNFAVGICEGPISGLGRVWADGQELDLAGVTYRLYTGEETQQPDSLITTREGVDLAPAYRGLAYIVFEHLPLAAYGNRLPQLSFEVHRSVDETHAAIRGVVIIPGSGEFVYATEPVTRLGEGGARVYENVHTRQGRTDWQAAIDQLETTLPNARSASLVVSWFGSDLRAGACTVRPGVELAQKDSTPITWSVAGIGRDEAHLVSLREGRPAYGGTPADATVVAAIKDLKARGFSVVLNPFLLMDIAADNTLPNPLDGSSSQPAYPWRGRISLDPAPGQPGSPDKTAAAAGQVAAFAGSAGAADFAIDGETVIYSGPTEWTFRRQVLHYAWLAKASGGVDAFVIGSELRSLTQARDGAASYPFVEALVALASDVNSILGTGCKVTYAADWSEYFGHQPRDGTGDVYFHLDPLWSSPDIDAIGIDLYWPLSDWREGSQHADALAGARSIYDLGYLKSNIAGGEGYDWYYASLADRDAQARTTITDGAGKPWVFRFKDLKSWWSNPHFDRPAGVEAISPTDWTPESKPVWLMECGCPAVDKGANQPNAFVDPKSSESTLPYYSTVRRDDLMQRRYLQALTEAFDPEHTGYLPGANPLSSVYADRMIDLSRLHVYAWDARPFPAFPSDVATWGDGDNWRLGHWLNGRLAAAPLADVVATILDDHGFADYDASLLEGVVAGYAIDRIMSPREALQPLELSYFFDSLESFGRIAFRHRGAAAPVAILAEEDLVEPARGGNVLTLTRGQESELPTIAKVAYISASGDYRQAIADARRLAAGSGRVAQAELAIVLDSELADAVAETWLFEAWAARERAAFRLPPSWIGLEPGDVLALERDAGQRLYRVTEIGEHGEREVEARAIDPAIYALTAGANRALRLPPPPIAGLPLVEFLDLPILDDGQAPQAGYVAATQTPWPGGIAFYSSPESTGFTLAAIASAPATTGVLVDPLPAGPSSRFDRAANVRVRLDRGALFSTTRLGLLAGGNAAAIRHDDGRWEVLQFENAALVDASTYEISGLLRGQGGTEDTIESGAAAGARFVLLDDAVTRIDLAASEVGLPLNWRFGPAGRDLGEESFASRVHAFQGLGMRPFSPVHVRGSRIEDDLTVNWMRRTRIGGDSWDGVEVPLGEESERYEIDIISEGNVVRTLTSTAPSVTYSAAEQAADFGSPQAQIQLRVHQTNSIWGRGARSEAVI